MSFVRLDMNEGSMVWFHSVVSSELSLAGQAGLQQESQGGKRKEKQPGRGETGILEASTRGEVWEVEAQLSTPPFHTGCSLSLSTTCGGAAAFCT